MKGPPTQEDILKLGKSHSMQNIGNLDLSERNIGRIDSEVFNQLKGLQTLDLSQNCLTSIPSDLHLPSLQTLDLSYNQLHSVDFVKQFDNLQQLYLGDNDAIKIEDYYTAKVLCPSLRGIDGAEDIKHIDKGISLYTDQLQPQIEAVWEARFSEVYSNGVNKEEMESLHEEFVNTINQGNIISHLCRKLISDVNQGKVKSKRRSTKSSDGQNTPSYYGTRIARGVTPVKHYSNTEEPISDTETAFTQKQRSSKKRKREDSPNTSPVKSSPIKRKRESSPVSSPVKSTTQKRKRETTPDSCEEFLPIAKRKKDNTKGTPDFTKLRKSIQGSKLLKGLPDYEPALFIRCHSNGNNPSDGITKIWNCAFEPLIGSPGETTNILATCGGKNICFTDCQTGKVMKRYKDCSKSESFYALAWTTLEADGKHMKDDVNILAVAGQDEEIKLIHPTQLVMFGRLKGHKGYISSLAFHPHKSNILFSGSKDGKIIMWEIGMPDFKDFSIKWKQRAVLTLPKTDTICLVVNSELEVLIVGCENSCYGWKLEKLYKNEKNLNVVPDFEFVHPKLDDDDEPVVIDGLALLSNNCIVTKCVDENRLYLWDLEPHTDGGFKGPKPYRILVSPMAELQYINTAVDYLYLHSCKDILSVGDDKGNIYMYNLKSVVSKKKNCDEVLLPSLTLEYPDLNIDTNYEESMKDVTEKKNVVINCLGQSSDGEYMVCGTDNNLLCIWQACS